MKRLLTSSIFLILTACGGGETHEAGVTSGSTSNDQIVNETRVDSASKPDVAVENRQEQELIPDTLLPIIDQFGKDTSIYISDYDVHLYGEFRLPTLPISKEGDLLVITHPAYEYKLREIPFDQKMNDITVDSTSGEILLINEHGFIGTDGMVPSTELARFTYKKNDGDVEIVNPEYYQDLYNLYLQNSSHLKAYKLNQGGCLIKIKGGDGSYAYTVLFLMDRNGTVVKRVIS